jgi:ribosome-binding protein aMBF1 (putative translation factor)
MTVIGAFATTEDWEADLGTQIRRARLEANISQEDLATRANISVAR